MEKNLSTAKTTKAVQVLSEKWLVNEVSDFMQAEGKQLALPKDYDAIGAAKAFHLQLQSIPDLAKYTTHSIRQAAFTMISKGLDPRKKQCYLIPYGSELKLHDSYFGIQKQAFAFNQTLKSINAQVIRQGDKYKTQIRPDGSKFLVEHTSDFANRKNPIIGAYAVATFADNYSILDEMDIEEIHQSWSMSKTGGATHKRFPVEMCRKTIKSRLCKALVNVTSDDAVLNKVSEELKSDGLPNIEEDIIDYNDFENDLSEIQVDVNDIEDTPADTLEEDFADYTNPDNYDIPSADSFDEPVVGDIITVKYPEWANEYKPTGEWKQVNGTYDKDSKTIQIEKIA